MLASSLRDLADAWSQRDTCFGPCGSPKKGTGQWSPTWDPFLLNNPQNSLPELVDFKLFGKTILAVNKKFKLFLASQLGKWKLSSPTTPASYHHAHSERQNERQGRCACYPPAS